MIVDTPDQFDACLRHALELIEAVVTEDQGHLNALASMPIMDREPDGVILALMSIGASVVAALALSEKVTEQAVLESIAAQMVAP